ncbi:DnaJ-related protein scj1, partial [Oleoguttula sp. CCFEE 5521]
KDPELGVDAKTQTDGTFFRRKGPNLFWREVLSLREAWMGGWTRNLTHLDNHIVQLSRPIGTVVQPGTVEIIANEGMPVWQQGESGDLGFGALHVEYLVVLPDQMEKGMGKDFSALWEKWRKKTGVDLGRDSGRPAGGVRVEL